jgi:chromate transporter
MFLVVGVALWLVAMAVLYGQGGWQGTLTQMGWFFTKAAFLTIGGAYAVLPYVYQGGVEQYGWLTGLQMIDGLALGETTPGPLIMVVTYVGYIGGWTKQVFGPEQLALGGLAGAMVATFFTFLPSFLFILIGGPAIEASRHDIKLSAPLTAITAAVVGVIINLAVFFAYHVLWPQGITQPFSMQTLFTGFQWISMLIGIAAFVALWRYKIGVITVIGACGLAGLLYTLARPLLGA